MQEDRGAAEGTGAARATAAGRARGHAAGRTAAGARAAGRCRTAPGAAAAVQGHRAAHLPVLLGHHHRNQRNLKSVVKGQNMSVIVNLGGRLIMKKKKK